ncbi:fluoride efflux transporter CrcB [Methylomonas sp. LL1]|uniref:fluoride efflux transporter CrcB n=1 Tax=Methylomonas sp. LL1 TaxID=2785785 RepID=UPI0018C3F9E7|nr:fluoride efflux transporter CrcB [Methylomonas sp. LL1]QPK63210.1 fluoride efflux transporter CrcB [Methylomonas sp. LL1]
MNQLIAIALGGSAGAVARFLVANGIYAWLGRSFPFGTLFINVSGSFLMGFLTVLLMQRFTVAVEYRAAILVGFLGAYTTFSTFALESFYLFEEGDLRKAALNIFLSVVLCLVAVWFGMLLGRTILGDGAYPWLDDLPYARMMLGIGMAFLLAALAQFMFQRLSMTAEWRLITLILLLGVLTVSLTLWLAFKLFHFQLELHEILGIFITTNLLGMLVMWLGTLFGNWLWQLNLLR